MRIYLQHNNSSSSSNNNNNNNNIIKEIFWFTVGPVAFMPLVRQYTMVGLESTVYSKAAHTKKRGSRRGQWPPNPFKGTLLMTYIYPASTHFFLSILSLASSLRASFSHLGWRLHHQGHKRKRTSDPWPYRSDISQRKR